MENNEIKLVTGNMILEKNIPATNWIVEGFLPEGLCILAGSPKSGKSLLALNLSLSLSSGIKTLNQFTTSAKNVLYIPYEDNERRIQDRLNKIKTGLKIENCPKIFFPDLCLFPKLDTSALSILEKLISECKIKLAVIDTLGSGLVNTGRRSYSAYMDEYELLNKFQVFSLRNNISLIIIHHTRKMKSDNVFDEISGTRGITGAADVNLVLEKNKVISKLHIQGRDLEEKIYELQLDKTSLTWQIKNEFHDHDLTPEQKHIIDAFNNDYEKEMQPRDIVKIIGKEGTNIRPIIGRLVDSGYLRKDMYGKYKLATIN